MGFHKTLFPYFENFCINKFGADIGKSIFDVAENKLFAMIKEADYRNSKYVRWHMDKNILPVIAIFQTFKQFASASEMAYDHTDEVMQIFRLKNKKKNQFLGKLPFGYLAFKMFCRSVVSKNYPKQGWDVQWIQNDKDEICFHMKSCIYFETTQKYACPELCSLFCKNDDVILDGYKPAIVFNRNETIANGSARCDFHFKNGKRVK